jgi:hypothetical protein
MQEQEIKLEELFQAVCWKLGFEPDSDQLKAKWKEFEKSNNYQERVSMIYESLLDVCRGSLAYRLGIQSPVMKPQEDIHSVQTDFPTVIFNKPSVVSEENLESEHRIVNQEWKETIREAIFKALSPHHDSENKPSPIEETPVPPVALWEYLPVPNDEPDKHDESHSKSVQSPEGLNLIGARVRGKMHKHNGTNCDDWFEFAISGDWTIIAVSDGAGSKKFSRVGAKVSCQAAVDYLTENLKSINIESLETKEALQAALGRDANWAFTGKDIDSVQNTLHQAMKVAYDAVKKKAEACSQLVPYYKSLENRELDIKDLSATLLLAVHTTINVGETQYSLVLTCQVGDGMLAAISKEGTLRLLGEADSGEFAGQTKFLTSQKKIYRENLIKKTFVFPGDLKALMVMTDGVADDYFPNNPQILELYGDLVLNQVIGIRKPNDSELNEKLRQTNLGSLTGVKDAKPKFQVTEKVITADETKEVKISYVDTYAKELGLSPEAVVASSALLWAGATGEPMCDECKDNPPQEKLRVWLDSYYRRGSFDDRTLVVLYRNEV